jgi:hypothetical protein
MLVDPERGRSMMIGLFETQADLDESLPALQQMTPPEGVGSMTSADIYEVVADVRM